VLELEALDREAAAEMLTGLPDEARELIVTRAEGNPFYVEELTGSLLDHGFLTRVNGGWLVHDLDRAAVVPDSVHGVVAARIDLLPAAEKEALQAASVVGRVFWDGPVRELIDRDEADLALLEERDFIRRRHGSSLAGELEFAIKHALTREVAYASIPKARRARLHAAFAGWLERRAESHDEVASLLAHHYSQAVRPEDVDLAWAGDESRLAPLRARAVDWLERAAELAIARYDLDDALVLLERAVELAAGAERQAQLWRMIGRAHALRFEGEPFWLAMQRSLAVCFDRATCAESYADLALETASRSGMWRKRPESDLVERWIENALELAEPISSAHAKALVARAFWTTGTRSEAREASLLADRIGDPSLRTNALVARSLVAFREAHYDEALTWAQRSLDLLPEVTDPDVVASALAIASSTSCAVGRFREARRLAEEHDRVAAPLSPHHRVHGVAVLLEVEELAGAWEAISALTPRAEQDVDANLDTPCIRNARSLFVAAAAAHATGSASAGDRLERKAETVATEGYDFVLAAPRLRLALLRGDLDSADEFLAQIDPARGQSWFGLAAEAARLDALAALGRREQVEELAEPALRPGSYLHPFARRALGVVRADRELLRDAVRAFDSMGLDWHVEQTRALL
jgi:tetratricopeptide (TPR) repeat protein